jgi:anthranilate phosphoribosyltransferase
VLPDASDVTRIKGESVAETIAFMRALEAGVGRLEVPADCPRPVVLPSYDGPRRQLNLAPLLALLLERYGVPVLVHGPGGEDADPADEAVGGAADAPVDGATVERVTTLEILRELGVEPARSLDDANRRLAQHRIAYVPTAVLAPGLAPLLGYRARLGVRSCAHLLAKLMDPFHGDGYRVVRVTCGEHVQRMREVLIAARVRALLLHEMEDEPFAGPCRQIELETFSDGVGATCGEWGTCRPIELPALPGPIDASATAAWIMEALAGSVPVPASVIAQLGCCLEGTRRLVAAA